MILAIGKRSRVSMTTQEESHTQPSKEPKASENLYQGDEILRISYPRKADETRNPMKPKSNTLDLRQGEILVSKLTKIGTQIWVPISKMKLTI